MSSASPVGHTIFERAVMLDAGPLITLYDKTDPRNESTTELLHELQRRSYPVYITHLVAAEAHRYSLHHFGISAALSLLQAVYEGHLNLAATTDEDPATALSILARFPDQDISFTDAATMVAMLRLGIRKVFTFDRHFWLLNFQVIPPLV